MISKSNRSALSICREDVKLSDKDILKRYLMIDELPCTVQSPLRNDDNNPSFALRETLGTVYWKDFGTGEGGTVVTLLARLWGVEYKEALLKIQMDMNQRVPSLQLTRKYNGKIHLTSDSTMDVHVRPWKDWDIEFWNSFGISQKMCNWCNVYPVSHVLFTKKDNETGRKISVTIPADKYAYAYIEWKDDNKSIKLYQPYSQNMKWLSKHDSSVWDLWKHAFKYADKKSNEAVILTSSRKDAMCLWENLGVPAMALQGEGYIPKPQVMKQVLDKFKSVYLWYDNDFSHTSDNPGQDNAKKLIELYPSLKNICIPSELKCKDPSDLVKNCGIVMLKEIWNKNK